MPLLCADSIIYEQMIVHICIGAIFRGAKGPRWPRPPFISSPIHFYLAIRTIDPKCSACPPWHLLAKLSHAWHAAYGKGKVLLYLGQLFSAESAWIHSFIVLFFRIFKYIVVIWKLTPLSLSENDNPLENGR